MTKDHNIWMPVYIGDYLADTMHLSTEGHGAYFLAMIHYWKNRGAFPINQLPNIIKTNKEEILQIIEGFFIKKEGFLYHSRIDFELKKAKKITKVRSNAGQASGKSKKNKLEKHEQNTNKTRTNDKQTPQQNTRQSPSPSPSPNTPSQTPSPNRVFKNKILEEGGYNIDHHLNDTGRTYAKLNAPGWDMYYLIKVYNEGIHNGKRSPPKEPNAAFPAWCKLYTKRKEP